MRVLKLSIRFKYTMTLIVSIKINANQGLIPHITKPLTPNETMLGKMGHYGGWGDH